MTLAVASIFRSRVVKMSGGVVPVIGLTLSTSLPRRRLWLRWEAGRLRLALQGGCPYGPANFERLVADLRTEALPTPGELFASGRST